MRAWIKQRTRWMKGWAQTFIVHNARPKRLLADLGWRDTLAVNVFVGGMIASLALHGLFLAATCLRAVFNLLQYGTLDAATIWQAGILALGYSGTAAVGWIGLARIGRSDFLPVLLMLPIYWLLAWIAVIRALWELLVRPYHWSKTRHFGLARLAAKPSRNRRTGVLWRRKKVKTTAHLT